MKRVEREMNHLEMLAAGRIRLRGARGHVEAEAAFMLVLLPVILRLGVEIKAPAPVAAGAVGLTGLAGRAGSAAIAAACAARAATLSSFVLAAANAVFKLLFAAARAALRAEPAAR